MNLPRIVLCLLALCSVPNVVYGPTVAMANAARVDDQWNGAQGFVSKYRPLLFADSVRLTDSLAFRIVQAADANGISRRLAFQLVMIESRFLRTAKSNMGALGLTQVMPGTARLVCHIQARDLYRAEANLSCGFYYLRSLIDRYDGNEWFALTGYYRGPVRADQIKLLGLGYPESILARS